MWYDSLEGVQFDKNNGKDLAKWCGGQLQEVVQMVKMKNPKPTDLVETANTHVITVQTARGEIMIRQGDWVAKDAEGRFRIVRLNKVDLGKELNRPKPKPKPRKNIPA